MANEKNNVTTGKPKVGGAIFRAPAGTIPPTDAASELSEAFVGLGYISEDGLKNATDISTEKVKAWGGDVVLNSQTEKTDEFSFELIESLNRAVLETVHGEANVSGDLDTGMTVKVNAGEHEECVWVADMIMRGNVLKRVVIPCGKVTSVEEVSYDDSNAVGYGVTVSATPDKQENTHYEYFKRQTASQEETQQQSENVSGNI